MIGRRKELSNILLGRSGRLNKNFKGYLVRLPGRSCMFVLVNTLGVLADKTSKVVGKFPTFSEIFKHINYINVASIYFFFE